MKLTTRGSEVSMAVLLKPLQNNIPSLHFQTSECLGCINLYLRCLFDPIFHHHHWKVSNVSLLASFCSGLERNTYNKVSIFLNKAPSLRHHRDRLPRHYFLNYSLWPYLEIWKLQNEENKFLKLPCIVLTKYDGIYLYITQQDTTTFVAVGKESLSNGSSIFMLWLLQDCCVMWFWTKPSDAITIFFFCSDLYIYFWRK